MCISAIHSLIYRYVCINQPCSLNLSSCRYVYISYVVSIYGQVCTVCTSALYSLNLPSSIYVSVLYIFSFYRHVRIPVLYIVSIYRHVVCISSLYRLKLTSCMPYVLISALCTLNLLLCMYSIVSIYRHMLYIVSIYRYVGSLNLQFSI